MFDRFHLRGKDILHLAFGINEAEHDCVISRKPQIENAGAAAFATPWQRHSSLAQSAAPFDDRPLLRVGRKLILKFPIGIVVHQFEEQPGEKRLLNEYYL